MVNDDPLRVARATLLPAFAGLDLGESTWRFLDGGGRAVLLGETREEYLRREMDDIRVGEERETNIAALTRRVQAAAGRPALIAVDQELGGIQRLHRLVRPLPTPRQAAHWPAADIEMACAAVAEDATRLGINVFLSPVLDCPTGHSPWLYRREMAADLAEVSRVGTAYVRGIQAGGRVAATAKHFPGHSHVPLDPAQVEAESTWSADNLIPFRSAIEAGVSCVMTGAAVVPDVDAQPASTSAATISILRGDLAFGGVVISDDIDEPSIARGRSVPDACVDALTAGVDLLLIAGGEQVEEVAQRIADAVRSGLLPSERLEEAAERVGRLASALSTAT